MRVCFWMTLGILLAQQVFGADGTWCVKPEGGAGSGLKVLDGGDGMIEFTTRDGTPCVANKPGTTPPSGYLYFDVEGAPVETPSAKYVVVEYFDGAPGGAIAFEYDSATGDTGADRYRRSEDKWGGRFTGQEVWRTAVFLLEKPRFAGRQNLGADFRLSGAPLFVRSARITDSPPPDLEKLNVLSDADCKTRVKIGPGGQFIIGGFDPVSLEDARRNVAQLREVVPGLKSLGVTSHEGYVRWNLCEPEEGRYDWSVYDLYVDLYRECGLRWVPFLIVGSPYSLPDWYYKQPGSQGYVCLEHGETSDVESLWNPVLRDHVARFIAAFCDHYRDTGVVESILLGITGNYGEAIYVATGNDWTASVHGNYHTHPGYWAGDPYAVASFRNWVAAKYGRPASLSRAWHTRVKDFDSVRPFLKNKAPNDRAWLDFCDWYIGSMTGWAGFWLRETRSHFPSGDIYLCTGGHAPPEHGADFGDQCKMAALVGGGVRITNEGSNYRANFSLTRWVASAGLQYGAYFSFEPAGEVNAQGVIARIYNATASGARGLHYYYPNIFGDEAAANNFAAWGDQFQQRTPCVEIAVYYPQTHIKLHGNRFLSRMQPLRDYFDFAYASDNQILDGGLANVKALVLLAGNTSEAPVWNAIAEWVRGGGLLVYPTGMGPLRTVERKEKVHRKLIAPGANTGKGRVLTFSGASDSTEYMQFLAKELAAAPELSKPTRTMVAADGMEDSLFVTLCAPAQLLWLNYTDEEKRKADLVLPPYSIVSQDVAGL